MSSLLGPNDKTFKLPHLSMVRLSTKLLACEHIMNSYSVAAMTICHTAQVY